MPIETIKRRVLNRKVLKVLIAILLVSLAGVIDVSYNKFYISDEGAVILIMGVVFTIIIVPLMHCIAIPVKNRISCAIANGLARGMLGAYLIMLLTFAADVIAADTIIIDDIFELVVELIVYAAAYIPFLMCAPPLITDANPACFVFTICSIASFMIAEFAEKRFPPKGGDL